MCIYIILYTYQLHQYRVFFTMTTIAVDIITIIKVWSNHTFVCQPWDYNYYTKELDFGIDSIKISMNGTQRETVLSSYHQCKLLQVKQLQNKEMDFMPRMYMQCYSTIIIILIFKFNLHIILFSPSTLI